MLKAVIFDMDGVIIDSHPAHREAWRAFLQTVGKSVSESELDIVLDGRKRSEVLSHFLGELSEQQIRQYGDRKDAFLRERSLQIKLIPGILELLDRLRSRTIATAVATSASKNRTQQMLEQWQLTEKFDVVVTGNDVPRGKPDPSIYRLACQRLNTAPGNALAIEDAISGIQAARAAGLACVAVAGHESPHKLRAAGAAHVVQDLVDLSPAQLEGLLASHHPTSLPAPG
jgi:HAD superfamily hydrolase (TIGR01509 family)